MIRDNHGRPIPRRDWDISDYERVTDHLVAQVTRLQDALRELDAEYSREIDGDTYDDAALETHLLSLRAGDMTPVEGSEDE